MKLLLIQPPFTIFRTESKKCHPPLGLAYLAAVCKQEYEIRVLDSLAEDYKHEEAVGKDYLRYGLSFKDIKDRIAAFSPDVVGISCLFSAQSENVHKICQIIKDVNKKIITILGGVHPTVVPEEVLLDVNVDFVVMGEGEVTLKRLLECMETKKDIQDIEGIGFRYDDKVKINQRNKYQENLDNLPFPYWDIFPLEKYFRINNPHGSPVKRVPFIPMITSRGCPFECIFCSVHNLWGRNYRTRSAESVLLELDYLVNKLGVKEILFEDDNLTLDKERAKEIFQGIIDRRFDIAWSVPNGVAVQTLDDEMLGLMKRSGCYSISIGVESGDEYVLKNVIKKPVTLSKVKPVVTKARKLGLETTAFFVVGLPGENRTQLKNTLRFAESLKVDNVNFFFATPLPGTRLLELCKEKGLINGRLDYIRLKSEQPSFATDEFSISELNSIVIRERLKMHLLYLSKRPQKFISKFYNKLKNNRSYFLRYKLQFLRKKSDINLRSINKTGCRYSFLWLKYQNLSPPDKYHFNYMQEVIMEKIVRGTVGLDLGCGCGWDTFIMAKNNPSVRILGIDISDGVYNASRLSNSLNNVNIIKGSTGEIPLKDEVCDFVYSFGVLHHIPNYKKSLLEIARVLKKGGPCFLYLYEDHYENLIKYIAVKIITYLRSVTVKIPSRILYALCCVFSPFIFIIFSLPSKILRKFKTTKHFAKKMPFNFGINPFSLRSDLYDRFSVPIEHRFSKQEVYNMFIEHGFYNVYITRLKDTAGWVVRGYKKINA